MTTRIITAAIVAMAFSMNTAAAQEEKPSGKTESREIIIKKQGEKETRISVEVIGDEVMINGKPMNEYKDGDVKVKKRRMIVSDGDKILFDSDDNGDSDDPGSFFSKKSKSPFLGVSTEKDEKGARVVTVSEGSAAMKAGLQAGDIITKINDTRIDGPMALTEAISEYKPGDEVTITYLRDKKKPKTMKASLGARENQEIRSFSWEGPNGNMQGFDFPGLGDLDPGSLFGDLPNFNFRAESPKKQKLGIKIQDTESGAGVRVLEVEDGAAGAAAGIMKDDIITEINGIAITNTDEAREQLKESADNNPYRITARRNGVEVKFEVKIPKKLKTADL